MVLDRLSAYLRMAEQGERLAITGRGKIVAEPVPPTYIAKDEARAVLLRRARIGTVRLGAPNCPYICARPSRLLPSQVMQDLLGEVRG